MENRTPKSVYLTWVIIVTLFLLSLFALGEPSPRSTTIPITAAFSENSAFAATATLPPNAVPIRNFYTTHSPTLTWTRVTWATGYEIQISISPNFSALISIPNPLPADKLYYTPVYLLDGEYYWRVRALDAKGKPGDWSKLEHITVYTITPTPFPTNTYPAVPTMTYTPSFTPTLTRTKMPPTNTPTLPPPFNCSSLIADDVIVSGSSVYVSLHNSNFYSTYIQRIQFRWPSIYGYSGMYLSQMALDNYPVWQGVSASAAYPAQNITDTLADSYLANVPEIDRTVAGNATGYWTATFSLAPTNLENYVPPESYAALFYLSDPLHPSTPCLLDLTLPTPTPSGTPTVFSIPTMTYTPSYTLTLSRTPTTTRTPTLGSFPTNPPAPPTGTPTAGASSGGSPQPPPTLPGGGCVDNCG